MAFDGDRDVVAWLHRRAGFGLAPGELDRLAPLGPAGVIDRLVDPDAHGVAPAADPWAGLDLPLDAKDAERKARGTLPGAWVLAMAASERPLHEWMRWFWHGHFVSTMAVVRSPELMVRQLRMLGDLGLGRFPDLLRAVTIDASMLMYLDGRTNRKGAVNENYGREVLELFTLGLGSFDEADVRAGAEALTGWRLDRSRGEVRFDPAAHDDGAHRYLGVDGVHDLDTVVAAICAHEALPTFLAGKLSRAILGPDVEADLVTRLAADFRAGDLEIRPLVRAILEAGADGAGSPMVWAPVPWLASMIRATGAPVPLERATVLAANQLRAAGQTPMDAPNVAGWPGGRAWLSSSTTLARVDLAAVVADLTPTDSPAYQAAESGDVPALAMALGRPVPFSASTTAALVGVGTDPASGTAPGGSTPSNPAATGAAPGNSAAGQVARIRLAVAMTAPEMVIA